MKVLMICHCGDQYTAREADLKRGWGFSCGKSCAAIRRDYGRPRAKRSDGKVTKQISNPPTSNRTTSQQIHNDAVDWEGYGWDAHKDSF